MHKDVSEILFTEEQIHDRVAEIGAAITEDFKEKAGDDGIILISVLRGAAIFMADLAREIKIPCEMDYMAVSSYGNGVKSSGVVRILKDLDAKIEGRDVLIVEDILDSGMTLSYLKGLLQGRNPASIRIATLLDKPSRRKVDLKADYVGFEVPDEFVVGFGLDYCQQYRNMPYIGVLKPEVYSK